MFGWPVRERDHFQRAQLRPTQFHSRWICQFGPAARGLRICTRRSAAGRRFWRHGGFASGGLTHLASPLGTAQGGSGAGTFPAHGGLLGEGNTAFSAAGPGTSGQCLIFNFNGSSTDPSFAACPTGTAAGSGTQLEFNNAGAFGGTSNLTYASTTGAVTLNQLANGNETLYGTRTTDTLPTGNLIHFQNYAKTADLFKVDASGNVTATSYTSTAPGPFVMSGTEGTCPGAAAGKNVLCLGDTSTHTAGLGPNGGVFVPIPQLTGDLATAPQVVSTHVGHLNQSSANGALAGTIALSAAPSASRNFGSAFNSVLICVLTPTSQGVARYTGRPQPPLR